MIATCFRVRSVLTAFLASVWLGSACVAMHEGRDENAYYELQLASSGRGGAGATVWGVLRGAYADAVLCKFRVLRDLALALHEGTADDFVSVDGSMGNPTRRHGLEAQEAGAFAVDLDIGMSLALAAGSHAVELLRLGGDIERHADEGWRLAGRALVIVRRMAAELSTVENDSEARKKCIELIESGNKLTREIASWIAVAYDDAFAGIGPSAFSGMLVCVHSANGKLSRLSTRIVVGSEFVSVLLFEKAGANGLVGSIGGIMSLARVDMRKEDLRGVTFDVQQIVGAKSPAVSLCVHLERPILRQWLTVVPADYPELEMRLAGETALRCGRTLQVNIPCDTEQNAWAIAEEFLRFSESVAR